MDEPRRIDLVLLGAIGLAAGAPLALAPLPAALGLVAGAALLVAAAGRAGEAGRRAGLRDGEARALRRRAAVGAALALLLAGAGGARARAALERAGDAYAATLAALPAPARCALRAAVARSPVVVGQGRSPEGEATLGPARVDVEIESGDCEGRPLAAGLRARLYGAPAELVRGDRLEMVADLGPVELYRNDGLAEPRVRLAQGGATASGALLDLQRGRPEGHGPLALVWAAVDRARAAVRRRIEQSFAPALAPYARALVLGETDLDAPERDAFRLSALAHLLAVSGTHLVLVVVAFGKALTSVLVRVERLAAGCDVGRPVACLCVALAWLYADFAGGGGSAYRAAAMLSVLMLARAAGRRPDGLRAFAWSLAAGAAADPLAICDLSFALSLGATAGLLCARRLARPAPGQGWASRLRRLVAVPVLATFAAMLGCTPVLAIIGSDLPLLGVPANLLAAPLGELVALPLCLVHAVLWWAPAAERGAAAVASGALEIVRAIAFAASASPLARLPMPVPTATELAALALGAWAWWLARAGPERRVVVAASLGALLGLEHAAVREGRPQGELRVSMLDVGQADALLVDFPDGRAMLVDGGGAARSPLDIGRRVLVPVLRARRRGRLDVVAITHPHPDHYSGLAAVLAEVAVGEVWIGGEAPDDGAPGYAALLAEIARRGVPVRRAAELCGGPRHFGAASVEVLAPCPGQEQQRGANDGSLVLRVGLGTRRALLMGDAGAGREQDLLAGHGARARLAADLLKVGHHGGRDALGPAFVAAVSPAVAFVSCGVRNRFGHPDPGTLAELARAGAQVARTDRGGGATWTTDGTRTALARH